MAISPEYLSLLRVGIYSSPEWKEAWGRVNAYLDALKTPESVDREKILLAGFERAIARKKQEPFVSATALAFEETQVVLDQALSHLIDEGVPVERRSVEERVRLYLAEWPGGKMFGSDESISPDVLQALREVHLRTSPALQMATVTSRPLRFTIFGEALVRFAARFAPLGSSRVLAWTCGLAILLLLVWVSY